MVCRALGYLQAELVLSMNSTASHESASESAMMASQPPAKKARSSLFGHYKHLVANHDHMMQREDIPSQMLAHYLDYINQTEADWSIVKPGGAYYVLQPLLERVLCVPASSAPVERVFSQSGLIMKPNRARMSNALLEELVFLKCNSM